MRDVDDNKLAYIAIGDAVLNKLSSHQEISRELFIQILDEQAMEVSSDEQRRQLSLGRSLLSDSAMSSD